MSDLIRDSAFGRLVRLASGSKYFTYAKERDPSLWKKYVHEEKSGNAAHRGHVGAHGDYLDTEDRPISGLVGVRTREGLAESIGSHPFSSASSQTQVPDDGHAYDIASVVRVDLKNGKDIHVVEWYGLDDPEVSNDIRALEVWLTVHYQNRRNWSDKKKFLVTFEICLLRFSIYIGSAIFSVGIMDVIRVFGVSQVAATVGLTLFVAGYGLGGESPIHSHQDLASVENWDQMPWAPMSEIPHVGRNPVYIGTLIICSFPDTDYSCE